CPTSRHVLVLPTPPLREMKAILRHPATGVFTLATSSRRRSSSGLGPIATRPWDSENTRRRHPPDGTSGLGLIISSVVNSLAVQFMYPGRSPSSVDAARSPSGGATVALRDDSGTT